MYLETEERKPPAQESLQTPKLSPRPRLDQMSKLVDYFCARCGEAHQTERSIGRTTEKMCKCGIKLHAIQDDRSGEVCAVGWKPMADKESKDAYDKWLRDCERSNDVVEGDVSPTATADEDEAWTPAEGAEQSWPQ